MKQIEITTKCNLKCFYCVGRKIEQENVSLDVFERIIQTIPTKEVVHLQGEGEPLLHPNIRKMIALCQKRVHALHQTQLTIP